MMRVLVTGANGFIGARVCQALAQNGHQVVGTVREMSKAADLRSEMIVIPQIDESTEWQQSGALDDVDAVIHLAARVHVLNETEADPLAAFRRVNVEGTLRLAEQARAMGVKRFVYVSSINVNGDRSSPLMPFTQDSLPNPTTPYGVSKFQAEHALRRTTADDNRMEVVILRPPSVYGAGVKGKFITLLNWVERGLPIPVGAARNRRSFVAVANLADALVRCVEHPAAAGQTFLISDGEHPSTPQLLRRLGAALGKRPLLLPVPERLLRAVLTPLGREGIIDNLFNSLVVDDSHLRRTLDWQPPMSMDDALRETAAWWKAQHPTKG